MSIETLQPSLEPTRTIKLWSPNTIGALTFFTGFPSGITLASINWFKMGMKWKAFANILIGMVGILIIYLIPENLTRSVALLINLGFVAYIRYQMEADIDLVTDDFKVEKAFWFSGLLYSLLGWGIIIVIAASMFILEPLMPGTSSYYYNRGNSYLDKEDYKNAIASYNKAIELDLKDSYSYTNRGYAYVELGELDLAFADYNEAIELNPEDYFAYNNRGLIFQSRSDYDRAIEDFTIAIQIDPETILAYRNRGITYRMKGEYGNAISDFTNVIRIDPNNIEAYFERGYVYMMINDYNGAIPNYSKINQIDPSNALAYYLRGVAHEGIGKTNEAKNDFNIAHELTADPVLKQKIEYELQKLNEQ